MTLMLLEWVITSVFLILVVLALRAAFGRRVSARLRYALWAVVLARLLVPVQLFTSPLAGTRFFSESRTEQTVTEWPITSEAHVTAGPDDGLSLSLPDEPHEPLTTFPAAPQAPKAPTAPIVPEAPSAPAAPDMTKLPVYFGWVWLGGSIALALVLAASNLRFALRLRRCRIPMKWADCPLPVYAAVGLPSPCLFGLIRPAVYVTPEAAADPDRLRHVIAHEYTHFRQGDHLWSFLRCAALAAHWWNPLVWLAVRLSRRDGELACDEGALKRLGDGERLAYGNTLLALVTAKPGPGDLLCFATTMAGEKKSLKERISRIANAPKRWLWAAVAVVLATALACLCAFGSAEEPEQADSPDLAADLTFSLSEGGTSVKIEGSIDGMELNHALWFTPSWFGLYDDLWPKLGLLEFEMPLCDNGVVCGLDARWTDESRTVVRVTASPRALFSSYALSGNLVFTVDLRSGTLLELDGYIPKLSSNDPERVPTEAEAVRTARIAAKLLTGAEDYYRAHGGLQAVYTLATGNGSGTVRVEGLGDAYVEWRGPDTSPSGGWLYFTNPVFCCPSLAGRQIEGSAMWTDEDRTSLAVVMSAPDDVTLLDSDPPKLYIYFTVELDSGTVLARDVQDHENTLELTDREMVNMARALAELLTGAENYYQTHSGLSDYNPNRELERNDWVLWNTQALNAATDLNRNGVPETVVVGDLYGTGEMEGTPLGRGVGVLEGDELLWMGLASNIHAGENSFLLYSADGEDYLMEFNIYGQMGHAHGDYRIFTLENGTETTVLENHVKFDYCTDSIASVKDNFDPMAVASFVYETDSLLEHCTLLVDTGDNYRKDSTGQLRVNLKWLETYAPGFHWYDGQTTLENLTRFKLTAERPLYAKDLNGDGRSEMVVITEFDDGMGLRLELMDESSGKVIWSEDGYYAHAGYNAVFLCTLNGKDYLLRYHPYMGQGWCEYSYELFTLTRDGKEQVIQQNSIEFDINFGVIHESFDPEAIAAFMDEINGLLANSVQLINTDEYLFGTFQDEGRLYDSLWWLDQWAPVFVRDRTASLLENLRAYKKAMEAEQYVLGSPVLTVMNETEENAHVQLRYEDKSTQFDADYWCYSFQSADQVNFQVLDLNGDGKDEIVFPLVWAHGTGMYIEKLYVFDAETLKQYDTSGLNEMILSSVKSTGDKDNFYLSVGGERVTIPKSEAQPKEDPDAFVVADKLSLGSIIRYTVEGDQVSCWLACDPSGMSLYYIGFLKIAVELTPSGSFSCGSAQFMATDTPYG